MKMQAFHTLIFTSCVLLAVPTAARSQDVTSDVGQSNPGDFARPEAQPTETPAAPAAVSNGGPQNTVPEVEHTGLGTLARDLYHDFATFPRRESTWVILGVGGGLAALAHPIDKDV